MSAHTVVAQVLIEYGNALRGDWSDFDGRSAKSVLHGLAADLTSEDEPRPIEQYRAQFGLCPDGNGKANGATAMSELALHSPLSRCPLMTDLRALLAPIRERQQDVTTAQNTRVEFSQVDAAVFRSQSDVPRLLAAIEAVAGLHKPVSSGITGAPHSLADYDVCPKCFNDDGWPVAYPCPTVAAVEAALRSEA